MCLKILPFFFLRKEQQAKHQRRILCNKTENYHLDTKVVIIRKEKKIQKAQQKKKNQERGVGAMKNMQITKQKLFKVTKCRKKGK